MTPPFQIMSNSIRRILREKFGQRVSFDKTECLLYNHDIGSPPPLIKPLISRRSPEGVVQPQNKEELIWLLRLANQHNIPLTPRGMGTSAYGGAIPRYGGLVVDFSRMSKVLDIDPKNLTATTEPGVVWLDLERELAGKGLALRLYPGSAPSSTVAGWLAQGGSGYGSYAYGWFGDNVVSAKVAQPDGKFLTYTAHPGDGHPGDEHPHPLDMVRDAEGITGFITEVTLKVKPAEAMDVLTASFETAEQLAKALEKVVEHRLKLWSVSFINPRMGEVRDKLRQQEGVILPGTSGVYLASFVFPRASDSLTKDTLEGLLPACGARLLDKEYSSIFWRERFNILKIKKLAPSLIPTKVAVPIESLKVMLEDSQRIKQPMAIEGVLLQERNSSAKVILLGFILHDERKISYNLVYGLSLSFIKLAGRVGGRPCATGIYFRHQAARIIGPDRLARLIGKKIFIDPQGILNPGKVIGRDGLELFMRLGFRVEPLIRILANRVTIPVGTKPTSAIYWQAYSCDQCGFCLRDCPPYRGWESQGQRGRWYLLRLIMQGRLKMEEVIDKFAPCSMCDECKIICPHRLPPITPEPNLFIKD